jgi:DNA-binding PadR family transcriptional regulator
MTDNGHGALKNGPTDSSTAENTNSNSDLFDDGISPQDLTLFQQEILLVLAREGETYGLGIKDELEDLYGKEINHGRLYPNLDDLAKMGLIEKSERDRRTNNHELTSDGRYLVRTEAERRNAIAENLKPEAGNEGDA